jgi:hypothetical protein
LSDYYHIVVEKHIDVGNEVCDANCKAYVLLMTKVEHFNEFEDEHMSVRSINVSWNFV